MFLHYQKKYRMYTTKLKPQMEKMIQFIILSAFVVYTNAEGISCFKCYVSPVSEEEANRLCSHFDGSAKYQVHCSSSTFCMKKTVYYKTKTLTATTVQRDCAPQKRMLQVYNEADKQWHDNKEILTEVYDEGCFMGEDKGTPVGPPEYCYCTFHLCNSSPRMKINVLNIFLSIMALLLILS